MDKEEKISTHGVIGGFPKGDNWFQSKMSWK
jgi:hypothetical protein